MQRTDREGLWHAGERAAWDAYRSRGYRSVARNWRSPLGELDLVVERDGVLVFCEVKARAGSGLGEPFESVTGAKRRKLRALAEAFIGARGLEFDRYRFDVASVTLAPGGRARIHLFEDAF